MKGIRNYFSYLFFVLTFPMSYAQTNTDTLNEVLTFQEYMVYVKRFHPVIKQADLKLSAAEANLLKSRGAFDPTIKADLNEKKFKGIDYFDKLNALFTIPTWFGIELKSTLENNSGQFLNPERSVPLDGLYSAGISIPLAKDLLMNERMATLKKARFFIEQSNAERALQINSILFEATKAYLNWFKAAQERTIYQNTIVNADKRYNAVIRTIELGQEAAIDSVEAKINFASRKLGLERANLKYLKAKIYASNFLWINDIPVEFEKNIIPTAPLNQLLYNVNVNSLNSTNISMNPKLQLYDFKIESLKIDVSLKRNNLLPTIDLDYNFLSEEIEDLNSFNSTNYKIGLNFKLPLFLRKERGDLNLSYIKLNDSRLERISQEIQLKNKIESIKAEIISVEDQLVLARNIVDNYLILLSAEERKFFLGESSLFMVNLREQNWIESSLKEIEINLRRFETLADLYNTLNIQHQLIQL